MMPVWIMRREKKSGNELKNDYGEWDIKQIIKEV